MSTVKTIAKRIHSLSADDLDKQLSVAMTVKDLPAIHALAEERLSRDEYGSGVGRRLSMLRQALDLEIIRRFETWKLGESETFYAYQYERKVWYERQGYDGEGDVLVVKGYKTVEAWCNIIRHYHQRHGIPLDLLSYSAKSKLEVASGACNLWDADHGDEMDPDLRGLLFDVTVTKDDILPRYAEMKKQQGLALPAEISDAEIVDKDDADTEGGEPLEPSDKSGESDNGEPLEITMDTESGKLSAWIRRGSGHIPLDIGVLYIRDESKKDLILNLCETWRVGLR